MPFQEIEDEATPLAHPRYLSGGREKLLEMEFETTAIVVTVVLVTSQARITVTQRQRSA